MFATDTFLTAYARTAEIAISRACGWSWRAPKPCAPNAARLARAFRRRDRRRLRMTGVAGGRRQFVDAWPRRHRRAPAAGNAHADRAGRRHRRGRQAVDRRPNVMLGYMTADRPVYWCRRKMAGTTAATWWRSTAKGSSRSAAAPSVSPRSPRDGVAGRSRDAGAVAVAGGSPCRRLVPDRRRGERIVLVTTAVEADRTRCANSASRQASPS